MANKISVIIPAYNEDRVVANTIITMRNNLEVSEIIVVDDGSIDDTAACARGAGAFVWSCSSNLGKGAALNIGASLATGSIMVFLDADLSHSAIEAYKLWQPIQAGEADCVIAELPRARQKGGFGLVKTLAQWGVQRYGGKSVPNVLSGQRAVTRLALEVIFPFADGYGAEVDATIRLLKAGFRIKHVEVPMTHRETGRDWAGFYHRGRQFQHILRVLAREALQ